MRSDSTIDFDELLVEGTFDDEEEFSDEELEFTPIESSVEALPRSMITASPFPMRQAIELVAEPEKLFDFSSTTLSLQQQMYIMQYAVRGTRLGACQGASVPFSVVDKWNKDEEFVAALTAAVEATKDAIEEEFLRRAMQGSDKLMIEAIRAQKPEKYGRKETRDVNVRGSVVHTWSDLAMQAKALDEANRAPEVVEVDFEEVENEESA